MICAHIHFCTTLVQSHVCLHANAKVNGAIPSKGLSFVRSMGEHIALAAAALALVTALMKSVEDSPSAVKLAPALHATLLPTCYNASMKQQAK